MHKLGKDGDTMTMMLKPKPNFDWKEADEPRRKKEQHRPRPALTRHLTVPVRTVALLGVLALLCACYLGPLNQEAATVLAVKRELPVYSVETDDNVIAISFDASWGGSQTMEILDILDRYGIKTTFFLVGIWVDKYPELVKEISARGHEIGNHSDSHPKMSTLSDEKIRTELSGVSDKIEALTGKRPTLFRPPYGDYNNKVVTVSRAEGYECVQWSVDSLDWKNRGVEDMVKRATTGVQKGDIVLFHNDSQYITQALPTILESYQQQGFKVIPVGEILLDGPYTIDVQGKQHPASTK